jgi:hypothetical protein
MLDVEDLRTVIEVVDAGGLTPTAPRRVSPSPS